MKLKVELKWESIKLLRVETAHCHHLNSEFLPDVDLQPVGHQELYRIHVAAQVQRRIPLIIRRQQIGPELVQEAAYFHVPSGGG